MKGVTAKLTNGLNIGSKAIASDNSGARIVRITGVMGGKTKRGRQQYAKIGDHVKVSVRKGDPKIIGQVFDAVIIRQKKPFRRNTGERVAFMDNSVALLKDEKGNPKGTQIKGPIAKEVADRWAFLAKIAKYVVWLKMKKEFSKKWNASIQPRKQRKYLANAPIHIRHKLMSANLSKELRKKYKKRNFPLKKSDKIKIMRGEFKNKTGNVDIVDPKNFRVLISGIYRTKKDGTKVNVYFHPSNLQILELELNDKKRIEAISKKDIIAKEKQPNIQTKKLSNEGKKNAPTKNKK